MSQTPGGPSDELVKRLYEEKYGPLRALSMPDKLRVLLEMQKIVYEIRTARGDELQPWEVEA